MNAPLPDALRDRPLIDGMVASLPLFAGLAPAPLRSVAAQCWTLDGSRGAALVNAGARLPGVFAVAFGSVKLALRNGSSEERVLRLVGGGQTFGEAAALLGKPSPYAATVLAQSKLVIIPSAPLFALLERESHFAKRLVASLAERKLELCAEISAVSLRKGIARLAAYLDQLGGGDDAVQLPHSKTVLAARLGMKKETLSRLLRQLAADGAIAVSRRRIALIDRWRLRQSAGS